MGRTQNTSLIKKLPQTRSVNSDSQTSLQIFCPCARFVFCCFSDFFFSLLFSQSPLSQSCQSAFPSSPSAGREDEKKKHLKLSAVPCSSGSHHGSMSDCHLQAMNRTARQAGAQICVSGTRHLSTERHSSSGNTAGAKTVMNRKCGIQAGDVKRQENTSAVART